MQERGRNDKSETTVRSLFVAITVHTVELALVHLHQS